MGRPLRAPRIAYAVVALVVVASVAGCLGGVTPGDSPGSAATTDVGLAPTNDQNASEGTLSVHFIHVGQGSSVLVVGPEGETLLYDTGNWDDDGEHVLDYLRERNVTRIDYLVTSHADADHVGGHAEVIEYFETEADGIGAVYDPGIAAATRTYEDYLDAVERHNVTLYRTQAGDEIPMAGASVRVLAPPEGYLADRERNENSLVLRVGYGNASVLLPGDAERAAERYLTERYAGALNATLLAAGHHGSNSSTGPRMLRAVSPRVVVVQSAYDSPYGHPHREVLARLADRGVPIYWTGVHGTVVFETDGERAVVRTQRDAPTDPLELRSAPGVAPGADGALERRATFPVGPSAVSPSAGSTATVATDGGRTDATETTGANGSDATDAPNSDATGANDSDATESPDGSSVAGSLAVAEVHADARGDEDANLNDEYVVLRNAGDRAIDLSGWTVSDEADHRYVFPEGTKLAPGETLTLRTGRGTDGGGDYHWNADAPVWNNAGDTVFVRDADGSLVLEVEYDG
ncbi:lamin tail domain-containing protein [Halorussus gelatinilyticus]|uniref:Lamin tail domain-containing protein n=1 Tax=Halorussus gelatinilyticus TaxID=2937524 RepID=A0A8U0IFN7_9EURY|nr:lamin tail domain-containing protein [Halorussus gelatinilyticus]UPV99889.1 lamin tail domain-containing protein [Halorussus gelatinilyticus]